MEVKWLVWRGEPKSKYEIEIEIDRALMKKAIKEKNWKKIIWILVKDDVIKKKRPLSP